MVVKFFNWIRRKCEASPDSVKPHRHVSIITHWINGGFATTAKVYDKELLSKTWGEGCFIVDVDLGIKGSDPATKEIITEMVTRARQAISDAVHIGYHGNIRYDSERCALGFAFKDEQEAMLWKLTSQ